MFEGVLTAIVTPFRDGEIDEPTLRALVERQITAGVDGLVPCGSTGESATLSHDEHAHVVEIVVDAANGRVSVVAGTGSNNTQEAIALTRRAKEAGADGALLISPYYNKPTQAGIVAHYEAIAQATELPLLVYNIPGRTASNILPETLAQLAHVEYIVGVKEACGDIDQIAHVIASAPEDFAVLSGDDSMTLAILALGGKGIISTTSNLVPEAMCELVRAWSRGDPAESLRIHQQLLPLFDAVFCETNPIAVKASLSMMELCGDEIRLPLTAISQPNREALQLVLKEQGLI